MSMLFKRIKDWATSITAFRTGDVIPVDGPNGTAKMSIDDLLKETAQNALAKTNFGAQVLYSGQIPVNSSIYPMKVSLRKGRVYAFSLVFSQAFVNSNYFSIKLSNSSFETLDVVKYYYSVELETAKPGHSYTCYYQPTQDYDDVLLGSFFTTFTQNNSTIRYFVTDVTELVRELDYKTFDYIGEVTPTSNANVSWYGIEHVNFKKGRVYSVGFTPSADINNGSDISIKVSSVTNKTIQVLGYIYTYMATTIKAGDVYKFIFAPNSDYTDVKVGGFFHGTTFNSATLQYFVQDVTENINVSGQKPSMLIEQQKYEVLRNARANAEVTLGFVSDCHHAADNMVRAIELANAMGCDALLNGGDTVQQDNGSGLGWFTTLATNSAIPVLSVLGNHDSWSASWVWSDAETNYNLIMPYLINTAGVTAPSDAGTAFKSYYYKDFGNVRVIGLDAVDFGEGNGRHWNSAQAQWLTDVLADARTNAKHVLIFNHYPFVKANAKKADGAWNSWNTYIDGYSEFDPLYTPQEAVGIVKDFIDDGGIFVCWLSGHMHVDYSLVNTADNRQMQHGISVLDCRNRNKDSYAEKNYGKAEFDLVDFISIDTTHKFVKFVRCGQSIDSAMQDRTPISYDYGNRRFLSPNQLDDSLSASSNNAVKNSAIYSVIGDVETLLAAL